jgi:phage tail-like protein
MPLLQTIQADRSYDAKSDAAASKKAFDSAEAAARAAAKYKEAVAKGEPAATLATLKTEKEAAEKTAHADAKAAISAGKKDASKPLIITEPLVSIEEYPIAIYQFAIEISRSPGAIIALFQSVTGISATREIEPLTEGGLNSYTHEFPGHVSYGHVTLETGLTSSTFFWEWMMAGQHHGIVRKFTFDLVQRRHNPDYSQSKDDIFKEVKRWSFYNAFPVSWKISDLSLDDSEKIVIESLELSFDFFELR